MNKLIILIATTISIALSPNLIAQPEMSLWWTTHVHGQAKSQSNPNAVHQATKLDCGQEIYYRHSDETAGTYNFVIHILNEGNQDLIISTPTMTDNSPEYSLDVYDMSGDITISPMQELEIIVKYDSPDEYRSAQAILALSSNDTNYESCSLAFDVGIDEPDVDECPDNDSDITGNYFEVVSAYHDWLESITGCGFLRVRELELNQDQNNAENDLAENHTFNQDIICSGIGSVIEGYTNPDDDCCRAGIATNGIIVVLNGVGEMALSTAENHSNCHCEATFRYNITNDMTIEGSQSEVNAAYATWYNSLSQDNCPNDTDILAGLSPLEGCDGSRTKEFELCGNDNLAVVVINIPGLAANSNHCEATFNYIINSSAIISGGGDILCSGANAPEIKLVLDGIAPWDVTYRVNNRNTTISVASSPYSFEPTVAGTYSLVSVVSDGGCVATVSGEAIVTEQECLDQNDFRLTDPCSCDNPLNQRLADGTTLFHDILRIVGSTPGTTHRLTANDGNLLTSTGTPIPVNTAFTEDPLSPGNYSLVFYTRELTPATISAGNATTTKSFTTASCTCQVVPTMGEWGLVCLSLLLLIVGVVSISQQRLIVSSKRNSY